MRSTLSLDSISFARSNRSLTLVTMSEPEASSLDSADSSDGMTGTGLSGVGLSGGLEGAPPESWMKATPVTPMQAELGARVLLDRRLGIDADARDDLARIVLGQRELHDFADLDAVVLHEPALAEAGHRFGEHDVVVREFAVDARFRQPQHEAERGEEHADRERADDYVVGSRFHRGIQAGER